MANKNENTDSEDEKGSSCGTCLIEVKSTENGLQCEWCLRWFHSNCEKVSGQEYKRLSDKNCKLRWFCRSCNSNFPKFRKVQSKLEEENKQLRLENESLKDILKQLQDKMECFKTEIMKEIKDELREEQDKEKRKPNLILFQMTESDSTDMKEVVEHDQAISMDFFTNGVNVSEVEIEEVIRLGKKQNINGPTGEQESELAPRPRPRPLLVKLKNERMKWTILKNAKNLKYARNEYRKISIVPDLTPKEREIDKNLRAQLKEKRDQGEEGWYIYRGKLLKKFQ